MSSAFRLCISGLVGMLASLTAFAQERPQLDPLKTVNEVVQVFPTEGSPKTAWKVHWSTMKGPGLIIRGAWLKRSPDEDWLQVLGDARVADMLIPYHRGDPRLWDIEQEFALCPVTAEHYGGRGKLLGEPPLVVQELRDTGIAWIDAQGSRRGQALVLWSVLNASNYRYIIEFGFQDDGTITFRLGSTGRNLEGSEYEPHMHNNMWRIHVALGGPKHNSVYVMEHVETQQMLGRAKTVHKPFNNGHEGWLDWSPTKFTMLRVINEKRKNAQGKLMGYDLVPLRMGSARHYGPGEECSRHDFWVTRNHEGEMRYKNLPVYVKDAEPILDNDVVLWYSSAGHHEPRSEDGVMRKGALHGATPIMWTGFELKPRHVFDATPLYR